MKILMLADSMGRGGTERRLTELLKVLSAQKHYSIELVVFSDRIEFEELSELDIVIHTFTRKTKKDFTPAIRLFRLCRKIRPDVVHSWGSMAIMFAIPVRLWYRPILINSIITDAPYQMTIRDQRLFRFKLSVPFSDIILANSDAGLKAYSAPINRSKVIYNGFDFRRLNNLTPEDLVRKKWQLKDKKVVGMVGAFEPRKDYETFIGIANSILSHRQDVVFIAVGGGSMLDQLKEKVDPEIRDRMIFTGITTEVESIVQLFDIGILLSNRSVHGEGISNSIMEYMALRKPVLANDNGGNKEIIQDTKTGFIIMDNKLLNWVEKINYLLDNPDVAKQMGQTGFNRVKNYFHIDLMVGTFTDLYEALHNAESSTFKLGSQKQI